jgi:ribosomal protein S18 acetylase RimI-like enzyme
MTKSFMRWTFADSPPIAPSLPNGVTIEPIRDADLRVVAHLMVDGYRGTIDFEGETDDDALEELQGAIDGANGPVIRAGWLMARNPEGRPAAAIAVVRWRGMPFISYVFTAAADKGRGHGSALIQRVGTELAAAGEHELVLFVTVGNPARSLYERLGFVEAVDPGADDSEAAATS